MIQKWVKPILPTPAICLTALLILVFTSTGLASNGLYEPCADTRVQRSDGFTLGIAFSSRPSFFIDQSHQLSPCDRRLSLASLNSQLAIFRPKVDEISLLTVNTSTFFPDSFGGYMVAFAGRRYAARSVPAFVANSTYTVTSFTLVRTRSYNVSSLNRTKHK
ncbi:uncharacterized protein LOC110810702 isoform X1 [Carica papaya]|uniref:uncharacterized protein LOC110810702 isoform X1 n=1 Tax=Carica papaya TaxID=3649 RepID=UPI000B8CAD49|nr:uncharacterized protein LOC110810702 isoform X1 [Carica papaya]